MNINITNNTSAAVSHFVSSYIVSIFLKKKNTSIKNIINEWRVKIALNVK